MATNNTTLTSYAATQSAYLDSLVSYVLDIKPYHSKLAATGAVSEQYFFSDAFNVGIVDTDEIQILLGADILPSVAVPGVSRARISQSWLRSVVSNGSTSTWPLPQFSIPGFASLASLQNFTVGVNDYPGITGLPLGVFNPTRFDGPGITDVRVNGVHQQDTVDYTLSYGNYAVDILAGGNFAEKDVDGVSTFSASSGALLYNPVALAGGTVSNISNGNYEEWTITTTFTDGVEPAQASVVGSVSGNVGVATYNQQFTCEQISFFWGPAPRETTETAELGASFTGSIYNNVLTVTAITGALLVGNVIGASTVLQGTRITSILTGTGGVGTYQVDTPQSVASCAMTTGDVWILTPSAKITVASYAPQETWSLIKSNPIALPIEPYFTPGPTARTDTPSIEIHAHSLDYVAEESTWSIIFDGAGNYTLTHISVSTSYSQVVSLLNGCSFKNDYIAFTLIPTTSGYNEGDMFSWTVGPSVYNYRVYGSVSGWLAPVKIGEWYWNGLIGFKIPRLRYFVTTSTSASFTAIKPVHSVASPSVYTITFCTASGSSPAKATVENSIYGFRQGLIQGEPWSDDYCSFSIDNSAGFNVGDVVSVYVTIGDTYAASAAYEVLPYESSAYDAGNFNLTVPYLYNDELFPLFENYGAVIWHKTYGTGTSLVAGESVIIDKAVYDKINLQIVGSGARYPELGSVNDWVPLYLQKYDVATLSGNTYTPTSTADFSDLATYIQAYSAADPSRLVFSILSPREAKKNFVASSQLTFDPTFFAAYLPFSTQYSIQVGQNQSYGQTIRVKITENLMVYALIYLVFADPLNIVIVDNPVGYIDIITDISYVDMFNVTFVESGSLPVFDGYDIYPFDIDGYDLGFKSGIIPDVTVSFADVTSYGIVGIGVVGQGVVGADGTPTYTYTGSNSNYYIPYPTGNPSTYVSEQPQDASSASMQEGLYIKVIHTSSPSTVYIFNEVFDFNLLEPLGWTAPTETTGLLISVTASSYIITAINLRYDPTVHLPNFIVESTSALGTYDTITPTLTNTPHSGSTTASYTFTIPGGLVVPFRLWIS